jgi:hypothetical protein
MLDPRIYRTGLGVVVLAVIVLAFSLDNQQGALSTNLAPDAFNGQNVTSSLNSMAAVYPQRRPGSAGDDALASAIKQQFQKDSLVVSDTTFTGRTIDGTKTLRTVTGTLAGSSSGDIVIVTNRDAVGSPAKAELSGTAVMLELARVLSGETHNHSIVLASISGTDGGAGASQLARSLSSSVDAVVVLGDLAGARVRQPIIVPWSNSQQVAPPVLRNTVAAAVSSEASIPSSSVTMAGQIAHLAFPLSISAQAPFGVYRQPAVLLSVSGERSPSPAEPVDSARLTALGKSVLQTINALDGAPSIAGPSPYLLFESKVVPAWAVRLLVLALILPVLMATVDGLARVRRRGHSISQWLAWVLAGALPFVVAVGAVLGAKLVGLLDITPPGPVGADVVPIRSSGTTVLVGLLCLIALSFALLRPLVISMVGGEPRAERRARGTGRAAWRSHEPSNPGAGAAVLLVMCMTSLVVWVTNPFAAALMVIALHLWMWVVDPDVGLPRSAKLVMWVLGLAPPALVVLYYALSFGLSPAGVAWAGVLLLAGGHLGLLAALVWSMALGCVASVFAIAIRPGLRVRQEAVPITVRGPITYAGPGSLGGTKSALRR